MRLQKSSPGCAFTPDGRRIKFITAADVVDGRIAHGVTDIVQGSDDAVAAPSRVFFDQLDDKLFELRIQGRPTELV
jgi:hypothetical protein